MGQHQMQKRLAQFEENEKKYQTHIGGMEEDYGNQINGLKDQIKEKIEIINKLMEDQETVTSVPVPSSRVFSSNENNSSSTKSKSLTHWKQLNQRNEKIISQLKLKIKNDEKKISELEEKILEK